MYHSIDGVTKTEVLLSSFPIIHKVSNIGIFLLRKFEDKLKKSITSILIQTTITNVNWH